MKLLIPIFIFITAVSGFANSVSLKDTTAFKGQILSIPVYSEITDDFDYLDTGNTFSLHLEYNALMLDVKELVVDSTTLVKTENLTLDNQLNSADYRKSSLTIKFDQKLPLGSGVLLYIKAEVLAGPDTLCTLTPSEFQLRDSSILAEYNAGSIRIPEPVSEVDKSYIGNFAPNPFHTYSKADLEITKPTKIKIATYNIGGADMLSSFCYDDCLEKHFRLTDGSGVEYDGSETLPAGDYLLELRNDYSTLSAGAYLVVIETDYKVLTQRFVVIK